MTFPGKATTQTIYAGDSFTFPTYVLSVDGEPEDLTGYTWVAQWRSTPAATEFLPLTLDLSQAALGRITPSAAAEQTAQMVGPGVWDLQGTKNGNVRTRIVGVTQGTKDVSRVG